MKKLFLTSLLFVYSFIVYTQNLIVTNQSPCLIDTISIPKLLKNNEINLANEVLVHYQKHSITIDKGGNYIYFCTNKNLYQFSLTTKKLLKNIPIKSKSEKNNQYYKVIPMLISGSNGICLAIGFFNKADDSQKANFELFFYDFQLNFRETLFCKSDNYEQEMQIHEKFYYDSFKKIYLIDDSDKRLYSLFPDKKHIKCITNRRNPLDIITGKTYTFSDSSINNNKIIFLTTHYQNLSLNLFQLEAHNNFLYIVFQENLTLLDKKINSFASNYKLVLFDIMNKQKSEIETQLWYFSVFDKGIYKFDVDKDDLPVLYMQYF